MALQTHVEPKGMKANFKRIEKIYLKKINVRSHLKFIEVSLNNDFLPVYTNEPLMPFCVCIQLLFLLSL